MLVTAISDLHNYRPKNLPGGDLLINCGDFTSRGRVHEVVGHLTWLQSRLAIYDQIVFIAGNHELSFEEDPGLVKAWMEPFLSDRLVYLQDSHLDYKGISIYGSPWQPAFCNWAFNVERGELGRYWDMIPEGTDILVTHGPPQGYGDQVLRISHKLNQYYQSVRSEGYEATGCAELLSALARVKPQYHLFGHIHEGYGVHEGEGLLEGVKLINAAIMDERYNPINKPITFEIFPRDLKGK